MGVGLLAGWAAGNLGMAAGLERIAVSVLPLQTLVQSIAGEAVEVRSLQQEGDACGVFEPRPSVLHWVSGAQVLFRTGVAYETQLMGRLLRQNPDIHAVDLRQVVVPLDAAQQGHGSPVKANGGHEHVHLPDGSCCAPTDAGLTTVHSASGAPELATDPHIWLDPLAIVAQARLIGQTLAELDPANAARYLANAADVATRAELLHQEIAERLLPFAGKGFYVYHPSFAYFARRYDLVQVPIVAGAQGPNARALRRLMQEAKDSQIGVVFVQPQESVRHAQVIASAIGATVVELDPLAADWEGNLRQMSVQLARSFATANEPIADNAALQ